jgi:hypothetical protein
MHSFYLSHVVYIQLKATQKWDLTLLFELVCVVRTKHSVFVHVSGLAEDMDEDFLVAFELGAGDPEGVKIK